jgi:hypothetical protein
MRTMRPILAGGFVLAASLFVGACGLFETREPTQPEQPSEGCRPLTTSPTAAVIPNIEDFYGRVASATCYASMVDDSFSFEPDPTDLSVAPPGTYTAWTDSVEVRVNGNIANRQDSISVDLTDKGGAIISPDSKTEQRFYDYLLHIIFRPVPPDTTADTLRYTGSADITFHSDDTGQWRMTGWVDHRGTVSDSTWGLLRGDNRF